MKVHVDGESLAPIVIGERKFDLDTYEALGLDLNEITTTSEDGLLRNLRLAAAHCVVNAQGTQEVRRRYIGEFGVAHDDLWNTMLATTASYREGVKDLGVDHPAIQAFGERNPHTSANASTDRYCTSRSILEESVALRRWFSLVLIGPNDESDGDGHIPAWKVLETPRGTPQEQLARAPEFVEAKIAITGIVGI